MENYLQYTIADFIEEASFIRWVNNEALEDDFDWTQWLENHESKKEEVEKASFLLKNLGFKEEENVKEKEDALWSKIDSKIDSVKTKEKKNTRVIPLRPLIMAAASILLIVVFTGILRNGMNTSSTDFADVQNITLPDGSKVTLNAKSTLKISKRNWEENRVVKLEGEAFFDVQKGSKFLVETKLGNVEVLGTSFNVYARKDDFKVICKTGKVKVHSDRFNQLLMPNQSFEEKKTIQNFNKEVKVNQERDSWLRGIYRYENESLSLVLKELERQFAFTIDLPEDLSNIKFTGSFNKENNKKALSEVLWPLGLKYEIEGKKVIVREE